MRRALLAAVLALIASPALACTLTPQTLLPGTWADIASPPFETSDPDGWLFVVMETGGEAVATRAWPNGRGGFAFLVPPSPDRPWQDVPDPRVTLTDGEVGCEMTGGVRAALTPAPGTMRRMIEAQVAAVADTALSLGADPAKLEAATREVPDTPGWGTLMHAAASARAALPDEATLTAQDREAQAVIDAYLANTAANARTTAREEGFERLRGVAPAPAPAGGMLRKGDLRMRPGERVWLARSGAATPAFPPPHDPKGIGGALSIDSAAHLSELMRLQFGATVANRPDVSIYRDTAGTLVGIGAVLGTAMGSAHVAEGYTVFANTLFVEAMMNKLVEGLYPTGFRYADLLPGPFDLTLTPPRNRGSLGRIMVIPRAGGVDTAKLVFDVAINFAPFLRIGGLDKGIAATARRASRIGNVKSVSASTAMAALQAGKQRGEIAGGILEGALKQAMGTILGTKAVPDIARTGPFEFPPVDIFGPGYTQIGREPTGAVEWGVGPGDAVTFGARRVGRATLTITSWPGAFGNFGLQTEQVVTVGTIDLLVDPADRIVMPGTAIEYTAFATGKDDALKTVALDPSPGFAVTDERDTRGPHAGKLVRKTRFTVEAADDPGQFPGRLVFTLPDAPGVREVRTLALPSIAPVVSCIEPGESVTFRALDEREEPVAGAVWMETAGVGRISAGGTYTAPDERGAEAWIELRGVGGDMPVDEMTVKIGCACEWSLSMRGQRFEGTGITAFSFGAGDIATFFMMALDGEGGGFALTGEGSFQRPTTLGAVLTVGDLVHASEPRMVTTLDPACARPRVTIGGWGAPGPGWLSGSVSGTGWETSAIAAPGCATLHPYTLDFTIRTGGDDGAVIDGIVARMKRGEMGGGAATPGGAMLQGVAQGGLSGNLCLPTTEKTP